MNTESCRKSVSTLELGRCKRAIVGPILAVLLVVGTVSDATAQRNAEVPNANAAASKRAVEQLSKKLYESLIREARALQQARQSGYRAEVWDRLKQAKQLPNADTQVLKAVAAGCMGDYLGSVPETALQAKVPIVGLTLDREGKFLATAHADGEISIVDRIAGRKTVLPAKSKWSANEIHFSPDGERLFSVHRSGVLLWRQTDEKWKPETLIQPKADAWKVDASMTPDGKLVATGAGSTLTIVDTKAGMDMASFELPFRIHRISISPRGKWVAAAYDEPNRPGAEPITKIFVGDIETAKEVAVVVPQLHYLRSLAFSSDENFLAVGCMHGAAVYSAPKFHPASRSVGDMVAGTIAFRPGTTTLALSSHQESLVKLMDVQSSGRVDALKPGGNGPFFVGFSGNGRYLAMADTKKVSVWDLISGGEMLPCEGHNGGVTGICFSPDGERLYSTGKDATIRIWNSGTGIEEQRFGDFAGIGQCIAASPDGMLIATGDYTAGTVQVWDAASGEEMASVRKPFGERLHGVAFSPDGRYLAAGSASRGLRIFEIGLEVDAVKLLPTGFGLKDRTHVGHLCFSPDSKLFAWTTNKGEIHVWDLEQDVELPSPGTVFARIQSLAFLPDSRRLAFLDRKRKAVLWDAMEGKRAFEFSARRRTSVSKSRSYSLHIAASPDGRLLATSSVTGGAVNIWDSETGELILPLPESSGTIWCMAFTAKADKLAVSRSNGKLRIWNLPVVRKAVSDFSDAD